MDVGIQFWDGGIAEISVTSFYINGENYAGIYDIKRGIEKMGYWR